MARLSELDRSPADCNETTRQNIKPWRRSADPRVGVLWTRHPERWIAALGGNTTLELTLKDAAARRIHSPAFIRHRRWMELQRERTTGTTIRESLPHRRRRVARRRCAAARAKVRDDDEARMPPRAPERCASYNVRDVLIKIFILKQ